MIVVKQVIELPNSVPAKQSFAKNYQISYNSHSYQTHYANGGFYTGQI